MSVVSHPTIEGPVQQVTVSISPDRQLGRIPEALFGFQHGEVADPIFRGLWAELLANRKFGGHDEPAALTRVATDTAHIRTDVFHEYVRDNPKPPAYGVVNPWYAVGEAPTTYFWHDNTTFYVGGQSQKLELHADDGAWHGVAQAGLRLEGGKEYRVRLVARAEGLRGLRVRLVDVLAGGAEAENAPEHTLAEAEIPVPGSTWTEADVSLRPARSTANGAFHIEATGAGTVWLGVTSLMPADNLDGFRPDIVEVIARTRPAVIRWGGNTTQYYRWRGGVGPRDLRVPFMDAWDSLLSHDFGTHEFVRYCRLVGAEPLICANAGNAPEDAAEWVEYCNGSAEHGLGRLRAEHGHPEPLNVKLWSLGNEVYGNWVIGHCDPETYGRRARQMGEAMLAVDPTIKILLVGDWQNREWNRRMLRQVGSVGDYLSLHWYPTFQTRVRAGQNTSEHLGTPDEEAVYEGVLATGEQLEQRLREVREDMASILPGGPLPIAMDEWSLMLSIIGPRLDRDRWGRVKDMRDALFAGGAFNRLLRQPDLVGLSTFTRLHRYGLYTHQEGYFASPDLLTIGLLREQMRPIAVAADVSGHSASRFGLPDVAATSSEDGRIVSVSLVNPDPREVLEVALEVAGLRPTAVEVHTVSGRSYVDANSLAEPEAIKVRTSSIDPGRAVTLPPASVTVVTLHGG